MSPQTPAQKRAKQTLRQRKTRAYAIIKEMAEEVGMETDEFLDDVESGAVVIDMMTAEESEWLRQ